MVLQSYIKTPEPKVVRVANDYRSALDAMDDTVTNDLANRWSSMLGSVQGDMQNLNSEILRRMQSGEEITQQILWKMDRYQILEDNLKVEINRYNSVTNQYITNMQTSSGMLGVESAIDTLSASFGRRELAPKFPVLSRTAIETMSGYLSNGAPLYTLLNQDYPLAMTGITNAILNSMTKGYGASKMAQEMALGSSMGLDRALLISRTELHRAYRRANVEQYQKSGVCSGFMRLVKKATACLACLVLDGETFELSEYLEDHPRGKCVAIPVVQGVDPPKWEKGSDWLENQDEARQREIMGNTRFELWKDSNIPLKKFCTIRPNKIWGDNPALTPIKKLKQIAPGYRRRPSGRPPKQSNQKPIKQKQPVPVPNIPNKHPLEFVDIQLSNPVHQGYAGRTFQEISKVHGMDNYKGRKLRLIQNDNQDSFGVYISPMAHNPKFDSYPNIDDLRQGEIQIRFVKNFGETLHPHFTIAHEFGHSLDMEFFGGSTKDVKYSAFSGHKWNPIQTAKQQAAMLKVNKTIQNSEAVKETTETAKKLLNSTSAHFNNSGRWVQTYLLSEPELFARAYAQYIAEKSTLLQLKEELEEEILSNAGTTTGVHPQWQHDDFKPILSALDELFEDYKP